MSEQKTKRVPTKPLGKRIGLNFGEAEKPVLEALKILEDSPLNGENPGVLSEASSELKRITAAVRERGGKGALTITINVARDGEKLVIVPDVKAKMPKQKRHGATAYPLRDGGLALTDPNQSEMDLDEVGEDEAA